jgi:hypothetical protein
VVAPWWPTSVAAGRLLEPPHSGLGARTKTTRESMLTFAVSADKSRITSDRPKTNIWQENAAEYSDDNEYSALGSKHYKKVKFA